MASRLVSHDSISEALGQLGEESLVTPSAFEASPVSDAELRANLTEALQLLEAEGGEPGVMVTAQNQLASLLQSYLADHPDYIETVQEPAPPSRSSTTTATSSAGRAASLSGGARSSRSRGCPLRTTPSRSGRDHGEVRDHGRLGHRPLRRSEVHGVDQRGRRLRLRRAPRRHLLLGHDERGEGATSSTSGRAPGEPCACNGNHEMYSGGYGYFDSVLPAFNQPSSCFAITNEHWLIVGLDSAYADHDLADEQGSWVKGLARRRTRQETRALHAPPAVLAFRRRRREAGREACGLSWTARGSPRGTGATSTVASSTTAIRSGTSSVAASATAGSPPTATSSAPTRCPATA